MNSDPTRASGLAAPSTLPKDEKNGSMSKGIVIAVDTQRGVFAIETDDGQCAVFCQHFGPPIQAGDILEGAVISRGTRVLVHMDGMCAAVGDSGPVTRDEALARVRQYRNSGTSP